nr:hypothetical protein BgiMline_031570 [Biomphalaria glabrata]
MFPTSISLEKMHTFWKTSALIQSSECTRTLRGDIWLVTKCSSNPEIQHNFQELLSNIKQMKTKDSFLNYVSTLTLLDIVRGCEKLSPFKDQDADVLLNFLFSDFTLGRHVTFMNVLCALCNGFHSTLFDKSVTCQTKSNEDFSTMSYLKIAKDVTLNLCEFYNVAATLRKCSAKNTTSNTDDSINNLSNSLNQLSKQRPLLHNHINLLASYSNQTYRSESINTKSLNESNSEEHFSPGVHSMNSWSELKIKDMNLNENTLPRNKKSCNINETYSHWTGQCTNVVCPKGFVHFISKCFKYNSCNHSESANSHCLTWREIVKGKFIPISKLFKVQGLPKLYITSSFEFIHPVKSVMNLTLEEFFNQDKKDNSERNVSIKKTTLTPNTVLTFLQQNVQSKSLLKHYKKVIQEFYKFVAFDSKLKTQNNNYKIAKIMESIKCFMLKNQCSFERHSPFSENYNYGYYQYINHTLERVRSGNHCDINFKAGTFQFTTEPKHKDIFTSDVIKAINEDNLTTAMVKIMSSVFRFFINSPHNWLRKIYLTFSNNMLDISKLVLSTPTGDYKLVNRSNSNITCPEGRTLTFSEVDVLYLQDNLTLKIYLNTEDLPIDNVWFELSMSVDIYEPVIETCILSLCVLPGGTSRFCPHSTFLKIPYSQAVFYKSLLLVSEDISQVEEFLRENKHTFQSPKNFLELFKSSIPNVLVYFKTSYIKTNSGVVLCVEPNNIYKDDTTFILNLYENSLNRMSSRTKSRDPSFLSLSLSVLLQILRYV